MGGSSAGLVTVGSHGGVVLATFTSGASAFTTGNAITAYGTTTGASMNDSGIMMLEAGGFTKWNFSVIGTTTSFGVTVLGTLDATNANFSVVNDGTTGTVNASSWFILDAPTVAAGTGAVANPITLTTQSLQFSGPLVAIRVILSTVVVGGQIKVLGFATS
jgi:hypothetical protein